MSGRRWVTLWAGLLLLRGFASRLSFALVASLHRLQETEDVAEGLEGGREGGRERGGGEGKEKR